MLELLNALAIYLKCITGFSARSTSIPQYEWHAVFRDITPSTHKVQINGSDRLLSVIAQSLKNREGVNNSLITNRSNAYA